LAGLGWLVGLLAFGAMGALAQDTSGAAPFTPQDLRSIPATDTTPIKVKIGAVTYAIPRNYILYPINGQPVVLQVTYPGFQPLTDETRPCIEHKIWRQCLPLQLRVQLGPLNKVMIGNILKNGRLTLRSDHPFGYDIYEQGPEDARGEIYRREIDNIYVSCYVIPESHGPDSICDDFIDVDPEHSIIVGIFIGRKKIGEIPEINNQITKLVNSFVVSEER
jgi:hypothetical protein